MKYLVNRETKEHRLSTGTYPNSGVWLIVDADDNGWIKRNGRECPLPDGTPCLIRFSYSKKTHDCDRPEELDWADVCLRHYRPILPAESKPEPSTKIKRFATVTDGGSAFIADFDTRHASANVFDRLSAAVAASESIPDLIAEINAMLPDGYEVREKERASMGTVGGRPDESVPSEDMSDWRNWREGDLVTCVNGHGWESFVVGGAYRVTSVYSDRLFIADVCVSESLKDFKFHSRPEAK